MPIRWRLLLGDVANNYRAALDHLAWALVSRGRASGKLTRKQENAVYFPYARSRTSFNGELSRKLPGVKRADIAKIRMCQPYHHPHRSQARHALVLLAGINNGDKHRTIQPVWAQPTRLDIAVDQTIDCVVSGPTFGRSGQAIEVGAELAFVRARRTGPAPGIRVDLGLMVEPSLENRIPVQRWLTQCGQLILRLLAEFSSQPPGIDAVGATRDSDAAIFAVPLKQEVRTPSFAIDLVVVKRAFDGSPVVGRARGSCPVEPKVHSFSRADTGRNDLNFDPGRRAKVKLAVNVQRSAWSDVLDGQQHRPQPRIVTPPALPLRPVRVGSRHHIGLGFDLHPLLLECDLLCDL
jgi:hypothetical protein